MRPDCLADTVKLRSQVAEERAAPVGAAGVGDANGVDEGVGVGALGKNGDALHAITVVAIAKAVPD